MKALLANGRSYTKEDLAVLGFRRKHQSPFGMAAFHTTADSADYRVMLARLHEIRDVQDEAGRLCLDGEAVACALDYKRDQRA
jgi:hypothetical protein